MKQKNQPKSIHLAFYFFLLVAFIVVVSTVFKVADIVRHSKFDGKHTFSVAVLDSNSTNIIFVSPQEGSLANLGISPKVSKDSLVGLGIPTDGYINFKYGKPNNPKSTFIKTIFQRSSIKTDLTILDLLRLSLFTQGVSPDKLITESVNYRDDNFSNTVGKLFIDPAIESEKVSIVITNATETPGLGNKMAKYIGDMGANVVLVNSSPTAVKESSVYFKEKSYTVDRISKSLGIKKVMKSGSPISDVTIVIGEDKADF